MRLHCHAQVQYTRIEKVCGEFQEEQVESLIGFDPTKKEDVEFVHRLLDEYLNYLCVRVNEARAKGLTKLEPLYEDNGFDISDIADTH